MGKVSPRDTKRFAWELKGTGAKGDMALWLPLQGSPHLASWDPSPARYSDLWRTRPPPFHEHWSLSAWVPEWFLLQDPMLYAGKPTWVSANCVVSSWTLRIWTLRLVWKFVAWIPLPLLWWRYFLVLKLLSCSYHEKSRSCPYCLNYQS